MLVETSGLKHIEIKGCRLMCLLAKIKQMQFDLTRRKNKVMNEAKDKIAAQVVDQIMKEGVAFKYMKIHVNW